MEYQGLNLGSLCKDSWFEVDRSPVGHQNKNNQCTGSGRPFGSWRAPVEVL
jgi:hypothetical protein